MPNGFISRIPAYMCFHWHTLQTHNLTHITTAERGSAADTISTAPPPSRAAAHLSNLFLRSWNDPGAVPVPLRARDPSRHLRDQPRSIGISSLLISQIYSNIA